MANAIEFRFRGISEATKLQYLWISNTGLSSAEDIDEIGQLPLGQVEPSAFLKSRLHREVARRLLHIRDVWNVRTLDHQMRTRKRREELGPNLIFYSEGDDAEIVYERNVSQYLGCLPTLLLR